MEVDGKEFMRNVALEQEQEKLRKEQQKLQELKREAVYKKEQNMREQEESAYVDLSLNDLGETPSPKQATSSDAIEDIRLDPEDPNKTKKKYILLGLALILVFVITILVIRVISNSGTEESLDGEKIEQKELITDKILDKIDSNEEFQKAVEKKDAQKEMQKLEDQRQEAQPKLDIPNETSQNKTPLLVEKPQKEETRRDPLGLDSVPDTPDSPPVVKAVEKKKTTVKPKVVETKNAITNQQVKIEKKIPELPPVRASKPKAATSKVSGFYIQIGAFTKQPSPKLLKEISSKGFSYAVHPVEVNGMLYNKVIIGPYPTRALASQKLPEVKQKFKRSSAYILKF
jgi:DedD protein